MNKDEQVAVEQCDREAAWAFAPSFYAGCRERWLSGVYDKFPIIQAFARHRIRALEASQAAEVAWLRGHNEQLCGGIQRLMNEAFTNGRNSIKYENELAMRKQAEAQAADEIEAKGDGYAKAIEDAARCAEEMVCGPAPNMPAIIAHAIRALAGKDEGNSPLSV